MFHQFRKCTINVGACHHVDPRAGAHPGDIAGAGSVVAVVPAVPGCPVAGARQCGAVPHAVGIITVPRVNRHDPALPHPMCLSSTFPLILSFVSNPFHVSNPNSVKETVFLFPVNVQVDFKLLHNSD